MTVNLDNIEDTVRSMIRTLDNSGEAMRLGVARIEELETGLNRLITLVENIQTDTEGQWPSADAGCVVCTHGTTPDRFNTGLCALHNAKKLLGQL